MTITTGDKLPDATLLQMGADGPETVNLAEKLNGRHEEHYGKNSLKVADSLSMIASLLLQTGESKKGIEKIERSIKVLESFKHKVDVDTRIQSAKAILTRFQQKQFIRTENQRFSEKDFLLEKLRASRIIYRKNRK